MNKSPDAFRTISEVADWLGIQAHVLRFWESKFNQVKPVKRAGGRRYYRPNDMQLLGGIKRLLYEDGMTIKGVQKILREQGVDHVIALSAPLSEIPDDTPELALPPLPEEAPVLPVTAEVTSEPVPAQTVESAAIEDAADPDTTEAAAEETTTPELEPSFEAAPAVEDVPAAPLPEAQPEEETPAPIDFYETETVEDGNPESDMPEPATSPVAEPSQPQDDLPFAALEPNEAGSAADIVSEVEAAPIEESEAVEPDPKARIVDAPDPPEESEILCDSGILSRLIDLDRLDSSQIQEIASQVRALENCMNKLSGAA